MRRLVFILIFALLNGTIGSAVEASVCDSPVQKAATLQAHAEGREDDGSQDFGFFFVLDCHCSHLCSHLFGPTTEAVLSLESRVDAWLHVVGVSPSTRAVAPPLPPPLR